jgi:sugar O-acyltransferase (sialic acid O-acetyltransferase NeuD family)
MTASNRTAGRDDIAGCVIIGAGGHARVLIDCIRAGGNTLPIVALDRDVRMHGNDIHGVEIVGGDNEIDRLGGEGMGFSIGVGATGGAEVRAALYRKALACGLVPFTAIHPSAIVASSVEIGAGSQIFAGTVINAATDLARNVIVNTGAIVEHDCRVDENAHIAPGACLGGEVVVGAGAHIGIGAVILNGVSIGAKSVVGAGAVVIRDVAPGETVVGNPAKPIHNQPSK